MKPVKIEITCALHKLDLEEGKLSLLVMHAFELPEYLWTSGSPESRTREYHETIPIAASYEQLLALGPHLGKPMRLTIETAVPEKGRAP